MGGRFGRLLEDCSLFAIASNGTVDVLYVVHPTSILEQHPDIRHVKPFLDKVRSRILSFDGIVIVSLLGRKFNRILWDKPTQIQGIEYVDKFIENLPSEVIVVDDPSDSPLGSKAMEKILDDLFLSDRLGKIIVGGCFDCLWMNMCVNDTINVLSEQYGSDKVTMDSSITLKAGPVHFDD